MTTMHRYPQSRLLIFTKAPIPGQVKTRLAAHLGDHGAVNLYKKLLRRTLTIACSAGLGTVELWCAPCPGHGFFIGCRRDYRVRLRRQSHGDLGRRMNLALNRALVDSEFAVLIGADCVSLGTAELQTAFAALAEGHDAVLGPAADGGYLLIGLRRPAPALFRGLAWSTPGVLAATRRRLARLGLTWVELPIGWDVDTPQDLRCLRRTTTWNSVPATSHPAATRLST